MRIAVLVCLVLLAGCKTVRLTEAQAVQVAQARADGQAAVATTDAAARSALLGAMASRLFAGTDNLDLPAPETAPDALVEASGAPVPAAVEREATAAKAAANDPPAGLLGLIAGTAGGIGLAALGVLRFSPGAFGLVANAAHALLAPKATKDMRQAQATALDVAHQAIAYGHAVTAIATDAGAGDQVRQVQATAAHIQDRLGLRDSVDAILSALKDGKLPALYTPPGPPADPKGTA